MSSSRRPTTSWGSSRAVDPLVHEMSAPFGLRALRSVPNPDVRDRTRMILNIALVVLAFAVPLVWVKANYDVYDIPGNLMEPNIDAITYLAAGERLNDGHDLYKLQAGDR